jgi:hypothetical protein
MSSSGPQYPPALQQQLDHAVRMVVHLSDARSDPGLANEVARAWAARRTEELETLVVRIAGDWRSGKQNAESAAATLATYLRALHAEAQRHLKVGGRTDTAVLLRAVRA